MKLKIAKLRQDAVIPEYQTIGSAGADLHACMDSPIVLQPLERKIIPTGLVMEIPKGYEVQIRARSSMSIKHGITMVNGLGTIDADYRGEVGILAINLSDTAFTVEPGMRIAQMVLAKYETADFKTVTSPEELEETKRGVGGYGSTGA